MGSQNSSFQGSYMTSVLLRDPARVPLRDCIGAPLNGTAREFADRTEKRRSPTNLECGFGFPYCLLNARKPQEYTISSYNEESERIYCL